MVPGRAPSGRDLIGRFLLGVLICAFIVWSAIPDADIPLEQRTPLFGLVLVLGVILVISAIWMWKLWRFPPVVVLSNGRVSLQMAKPPIRTSVANVADVMLSGAKLCLRFHDLQQVEASRPKATRQVLAKEFRASGWHFAMPRGAFNLLETNTVRQALGLTYQPNDDRRDYLFQFVDGLRRVTPQVRVTRSLIALNIAVFVLLWLAGAAGNLGNAAQNSMLSRDIVLAWGGNFAPLTTNGQPFRLLTCLFIHWSIMHLFFNLWVLNDIGQLVERVTGSLPFLLVYLLSGFCGSLATVYWSLFGQPAISAGASGAVFGVFGLLLGILIRRHRDFPAELLREHKASCISFLAFNLLFGFVMPNVDFAAHLGGLVGGFVCGLFVRPILPPNKIPSLTARLLALVPLCLCIPTAGILLLPRPIVAFPWEVHHVLTVDHQAIDQYNKIISDNLERTDQQTADAIRQEVVAPINVERERISALAVRSRDLAARQGILEYMTQLEEGFRLLSQAIEERDVLKQQEGTKRIETAHTVLEDWVKKYGKQSGLYLQRRPAND